MIPMHLCVASHKECWETPDGRWMSTGGFPLQMDGLATIFERITLVVVAGSQRDGGMPLPERASVVALRKPSGADTRRKLAVLAGLPSYLATLRAAFRRADAVHVPLPGDIPLLAMLVALWLRKPLLARYGGSWAGDAESTLTNRLTRACMRRFAGPPNVMLATGEGTAAPARGMHWIFSTALSERELDAIAPARHDGLHHPPRLIYAGRLSPEKGLDVVIEALARMRSSGIQPLPTLRICGDGSERASLERLATTLGLADLIIFAGQLARTDLAVALRDADLCVQPSRTEGFSKAWLDAMACGLPVVASNVGAAQAVCGSAGERGWLVPPGDAGALAARLQAILASESGWGARRARCRRYVETRTLEAWADEIARRCDAAWGPFPPGAS